MTASESKQQQLDTIQIADSQNSQEDTPVHHEYLDNLHDEIDPRAIGGAVDSLPPGYYRTWTFLGTFVACVLGSMCSYATFTLPTNILSIINQDLGPSPQYVWVSLIWTLSCSVVFAIGGRLSDILGRRWLFIVGNALGTIGAVVAATAKTINVLIGASTMIGIAAGVQQLWPIVINELVPNKHRGYVNAFMWGTAVPFSVFSPVIARSLITHTSVGWRGCYYIATSITGVTTILFYIFYHPPTFELLHKGRERTWKSILLMIDLGGLFLFTAGMVLFLLGVSWGGQTYPWKSGQVIGCIIGGVFLLVCFVIYELRCPQPYPLIPIRLFKNVPYVALIMCGAFVTLNFYNVSILWPMQATVVYQGSLLHIGWLTCATGGGALLGDLVSGCLIKPLGYHKYQIVFYSVCGATFTAALAVSNTGNKDTAAAFVVLSGFCVGAAEALVYTLCPLTCEPEDIGLAIGVMCSVRTFIPTISTAIYLSVLGNKLATYIPRYVIPAATEAGLPASELPALLQGLATGNFAGIADITPHIIEVATSGYQEAYIQTFRLIYLSSITWGCVAIGFSLLCPNMEHMLTDFVGRRLNGKEINALTEKENVKESKADVDA